MYPRFQNIDLFKKQYEDCPVCNKKIFFDDQDRWNQTSRCKLKHYQLSYKKYTYGRRWHYRITQEIFLFDDIVIHIGQSYYFDKVLKVKVILLKPIAKERPNFPENAMIYPDRDAEWVKEFNFSKFKKRFKFDNKDKFLEKIKSLKKAIVLT